MGALEAYDRFTEEVAERQLPVHCDYNSTSITSGGHARLPDADMGHVIGANTATARHIMRMLAAKGDILPGESILPVDLGKTGWTQSEYMMFWLLTIARPDISEIHNRDEQGLLRFERQIGASLVRHGVDVSVMSDGSLPHERRRSHYQLFGTAVASAVQTDDISCTPARRFNKLVDTGVSLGCDTENDFARRLQIPRYRLMAVSAAAGGNLALPELNEDLHVIRAFGADVFMPREHTIALKGEMLTLVRES